MSKDSSVYLRHIYDCIQWIKDFARDGEEAFFRDKKTQDAIIRAVRSWAGSIVQPG